MTITAALVLFAVLWFLILFIALPINLKTQRESGEVIEGTPSSAPENPQIKKKMFWVTLFTLIIWTLTCIIILSGLISISDLDFYGRLNE